MPGIRKIGSKQARSLVEYALVVALVATGVLYMSRYVLRGTWAGIKGWESQVNTSLHQPTRFIEPKLKTIVLKFKVYDVAAEQTKWEANVEVPYVGERCVGDGAGAPGWDTLSYGWWESYAGKKIGIRTELLRCGVDSQDLFPTNNLVYGVQISPDGGGTWWHTALFSAVSYGGVSSCESYWRSKGIPRCAPQMFDSLVN